MLARKGKSQPAKLSDLANALMENRNGLIVDLRVDTANGHGERIGALALLDKHVDGREGVTLGAGAGYDAAAEEPLEVVPAGREELDGASAAHDQTVGLGGGAWKSKARKKGRRGPCENGAVYTIRCTGKLLKRLGPVTEVAREPPATVLGDWYGTLVHAPGMQLVVLVSERTLLPVVVPARESRTLAERFPLALARVLVELQVALPGIDQELQAMVGPRIGKTASRQMLGTMNDFQRMMPSYMGPSRSLTSVSLHLAKAPCGPIGMRSPDDLTRELFAVPRGHD